MANGAPFATCSKRVEDSMTAADLQPSHWYWIRRADGSLAPYRFHQLRPAKIGSQPTAEFFVGSKIQHWPLSCVVGEAHMPTKEPPTPPGTTDRHDA